MVIKEKKYSLGETKVKRGGVKPSKRRKKRKKVLLHSRRPGGEGPSPSRDYAEEERDLSSQRKKGMGFTTGAKPSFSASVGGKLSEMKE